MAALNLNLYLSILPLWWFYRTLLQGLFLLAGSEGGGPPSDDEDVDGDINVDGAGYGMNLGSGNENCS